MEKDTPKPSGTGSDQPNDYMQDEVVSLFYFYAEAVDGSDFWAGPVIECLPYQAFDWCSAICNTSARNIGMREYSVPYVSEWNIGLT